MNKHGKQKGKYAPHRSKGTTINSQSFIKLTYYNTQNVTTIEKQITKKSLIEGDIIIIYIT